MTEDLIVTGGHSALVESLTEREVLQLTSLMGQKIIYMTDDKVRLLSCLDKRAEPFDSNEVIYHLCLEHSDPELNYGIWANGMLMETVQKSCIEKYKK